MGPRLDRASFQAARPVGQASWSPWPSHCRVAWRRRRIWCPMGASRN